MIFYRANRAYVAGKQQQYRPFEPMLLACSEALDACLSYDRGRALHALGYLYRMLDFQNEPKQSVRLAKLYDHCEQLISYENYQDAVIILERLRLLWTQIANMTGKAPIITL